MGRTEENFSFDMNNTGEMSMTVSAICGEGEGRYAFVTFTDGMKSAEGKIPDCRIIKSSGFSEEEIEGLEEYMKADLLHLKKLSAGENVIKAMMKETKDA